MVKPDTTEFTEKQATAYLNLLGTEFQKSERIKQGEYFEYGGRIFLGNYQMAAASFVRNNPTGGDFYVWLQQRYTHYTK